MVGALKQIIHIVLLLRTDISPQYLDFIFMIYSPVEPGQLYYIHCSNSHS